MKRIPAELRDSDRVSVDDVVRERDELRMAGIKAVELLQETRDDLYLEVTLSGWHRARIRALRSIAAQLIGLLGLLSFFTGIHAFVANSPMGWALFFVTVYATAAGGFLFSKSLTSPHAPDAR